MSTGTWHWKTETAAWSDNDWRKLIGRQVSILAPAEEVAAVTFEGPMVCIVWVGGGQWNFVREFGADLRVED